MLEKVLTIEERAQKEAAAREAWQKAEVKARCPQTTLDYENNKVVALGNLHREPEIRPNLEQFPTTDFDYSETTLCEARETAKVTPRLGDAEIEAVLDDLIAQQNFAEFRKQVNLEIGRCEGGDSKMIRDVRKVMKQIKPFDRHSKDDVTIIKNLVVEGRKVGLVNAAKAFNKRIDAASEAQIEAQT